MNRSQPSGTPRSSVGANPNANVAADPIDVVLGHLREEWRTGCTAGWPHKMALNHLTRLRAKAASRLVADELAALEARLAAYRDLSEPRRRDELPRIAAALKGVTRELHRDSMPAPPVGTLESALRQPKRSAPAAASKKAAARTLGQPQSALKLDLLDPVTKLPRVGASIAKKLANLGVETVADLIELRPRRYIDYSQTLDVAKLFDLSPHDEVAVRGEVVEIREIAGKGRPRVEARVADRSGTFRVTWFNRYVAKQIFPGDEIAIFGKPELNFGRVGFTSPEWEKVGGLAGDLIAEGRIAPVYSLTEGLSQKTLRGLTQQALAAALPQVADWLPESVRTHLGAEADGALPLLPLPQAIATIHYPASEADRIRAERRLTFDDLFLLQLGLVRRKRTRQAAGGTPLAVDWDLIRRFRVTLPFRLTGDQERTLAEIAADLALAQPMTRLIQGDVGSGKTVVAAAAALVATANGTQTAVMAPTEILAEQHLHNLRGLYSRLPEVDRPRVELLTGSSRATDRRDTLAAVAAGQVDVLVGTHAIIQDGVAFARLALSVVDEQHRFGVRQRASLIDKAGAAQPHQLSMTATPIPRTLNMVLNGDLDVSIIAERPPGRGQIETRWYAGYERELAYELVRDQVAQGRQAFVICPLVEASEAVEAKAAVEEGRRLQEEVFPSLRVATLHGRMSGRDKDATMTAFRDQAFDLLVSTSVIEVGVDVPNATVMLIEGADRFGLSQLHQFRGRVGRGAAASYCLLVADDVTPDAASRLEMMVETDDGFVLAEKDLELRGPGDFIGTRQSGLPEMSWVDGSFDPRLLDRARRAAEAILDRDPDLATPDHRALGERVAAFWRKASPDIPL